MAPVRNKRKLSYTAAFKLRVIQLAEERGEHHVAKLFNVDRKRVREWCINKEKIGSLAETRKRVDGGGCGLKYPDIEERLLKWFADKRASGARVMGQSLKYEALQLHKESGSQQFKASNGWYNKFKKRNNISMRRSTHVSQHAKEVPDGRVDRFLRYVIQLHKIREYDDSSIGNM